MFELKQNASQINNFISSMIFLILTVNIDYALYRYIQFPFVCFLSFSSYEVIICCDINLRDERVMLDPLIMISPSSTSLVFRLRRFNTWTIIGAAWSFTETEADLPHAGCTGSNATICCGMAWFGGKLSKYWRCLMYLIANL